ncbi:unnamed protein product [Schistosoma rodhaini]|uniref:Egg protein CP391S-like protein n=1 Tax=Schistosoma rodhaini TaxID=6188 RepID=A0AA85G7M8_9TREM|nr:unnamed protein product [Schistosoma rodhaini]
MRIQRNQSQPVPSDRFKNKISYIYYGAPQFSCSYYGSHVQQIQFSEDLDRDYVFALERSHIGTINNYIEENEKSEARVLDEKELLGVQRNFSIKINGSDVTATMTSLIHPNGKISFYYDNIPKEIEESQLTSKINGIEKCGNGLTKHEISVPAKWIKSGSLVEFEAIGEICLQYNTSETCQNVTTSNMTCIWCEKGRTCIESNDQNTHGFKVNDCRVENTSTGIMEENKPHKSYWYLYVVIPLAASLFLICIGYIIWRWLLRRKNSGK